MGIKENVRAVHGCLWEGDEETAVSSLAERYFGKACRILCVNCRD